MTGERDMLYVEHFFFIYSYKVQLGGLSLLRLYPFDFRAFGSSAQGDQRKGHAIRIAFGFNFVDRAIRIAFVFIFCSRYTFYT